MIKLSKEASITRMRRLVEEAEVRVAVMVMKTQIGSDQINKIGNRKIVEVIQRVSAYLVCLLLNRSTTQNK